MFIFEKLDVWHDAIVFADRIYTHTRTFPREEKFGLTTQMRRAAVSVPANVAEGSSRASRADFARFVEIASGSLFEVVSHAHVARRQGFLPSDAFAELYLLADRQGRMLSGLRRSLLAAKPAAR